MSNKTAVTIVIVNMTLVLAFTFALGYLFGKDQKTPIVVEKCSS